MQKAHQPNRPSNVSVVNNVLIDGQKIAKESSSNERQKITQHCAQKQCRIEFDGCGCSTGKSHSLSQYRIYIRYEIVVIPLSKNSDIGKNPNYNYNEVGAIICTIFFNFLILFVLISPKKKIRSKIAIFDQKRGWQKNKKKSEISHIKNQKKKQTN